MIDFIDDEQLEKMGYTKETFKGSKMESLLKSMGYTKETFKGSRMELILKSMISSTEEVIQEETQKLMKGNSLSYGEARMIATSNILNSITKD